MANIFDYLEWRADVPFSADPFNEVDNLILAELAYTDFTGIVAPDGTETTLADACRMFFETHSKEEILTRRSYTARSPLLMEGMASGARFRGLLLSRYEQETDSDEEIQFSAVTFRFPGELLYVAFRGTDGTLVGWKEDFNFTFLPETEGQSRAARYLNEAGQGTHEPIIVGGHSKGGNFAVYAASCAPESIRERILGVYSNDGPGFREEVLQSEGYRSILPKAVCIVPDTAIIGRLLSSDIPYRVVGSDASGIVQHDGFSWQVKRNRFVDAEPSASGELIGKTLGSWLATMSDETRRSVVDTVFGLFESSGAESFGEMGEHKWRSMETIVLGLRELPKEKQQELLTLLKVLGQTSGHTAVDYLASRYGGNKKTPE